MYKYLYKYLLVLYLLLEVEVLKQILSWLTLPSTTSTISVVDAV